MPPDSTPALDANDVESDLRHFVESSLTGHIAPPSSIRGIERTSSPFGTRSHVEVLTLSLEDGQDLKLFLKHLGTEQADHPDKQCGDREPRVYSELLDNNDLPVAQCLGIKRHAASAGYQILLEYIDDWNLRYQGMDCWFEAARRLAHLHAGLADRLTEGLGHTFLLRLDTSYRRRWAQRAVAVIEDMNTGLGDELAKVVHSYDRLDELLDGQPLTLVHNDLSPKNVIADRSYSVPRICIVDWEMAGAGCGVIDLAHLCHGLSEGDERRMCEAYRGEFEGTALIPTSRQQWSSLLAACKLHNTVFRLAHARLWGLHPDRVAQWVTEARSLLEEASRWR